jgi:rare lipoprotein A
MEPGRERTPLSSKRQTRMQGQRLGGLVALAFLSLVASGCRHRTTAQLPPAQELPPPQQAYVPPPQPVAPEVEKPAIIPPTPLPPGGVSQEDVEFVASHRPIATQTGWASWYTAPYAGRKAANGEVFSNYAMTAAHRTLPMGSLIVVTNLRTGQHAVMRVADRGPFVEGRIVDLTKASAKATGVYLPGRALVRVDVYETPKPIKTGGRWCVQIGAFHDASAALRLKAKLERQYAGANVIEFSGEHSYWVRIRPEGDARGMAEYIARHVHPSEGDAFLTRLD